MLLLMAGTQKMIMIFKNFSFFFAKPAASSKNIWHQRPDLTVFHVGDTSEMPKMRH